MNGTIRAAVACVLAAALAACGGSSSNNNQNPTGPVLGLSTATVTFAAAQAGSALPAAQTVTVTNTGTGVLAVPTVAVAAGGSWLTASIAASAGGYTVTLRPNTSALAPGLHTTSVTVTSAGASGSPKTISVSWQITPSPTPVIVSTPVSLTFRAETGGADPASQTLVLTNGGTGTLAAVTVGDDAAWLTPSIVGTVVTVQVAVGALTAGSYTGHVNLTSAGASNSPLSIPVTFQVVSSTPELSVSPTSLSFTTTAGTNPAAKTIAVTNAAGGTLAAVTATPSYSSGSGWMSAAVTGSGNSQTVTVSITAPAAGTYSGSLALAAAGATGSPTTVTVSLVVSSAGGGGGTSTASGGVTAVLNAANAKDVSCYKSSTRSQAAAVASRDRWVAAVDAAVTAGRMSYSQTSADACVAWLNGATCAQYDYPIGDPSCDAYLTGLVANGQSCHSDGECANGYCAYGNSCPGTCTAFKATDAACRDAVECGPGKTCDWGAGAVCKVATAPGGNGQPCSNAEAACALGYFCDAGTCTARLAASATCSATGAWDQCAAGLGCVDVGAGAYRCVALVGQGGSCTAAPCGDGLYCTSGGTCAQEPIVGESCADYVDWMCADFTYCLGSTTPVCTAGTAAVNASCDTTSWGSATATPSTLCAASATAGHYVSCAAPAGGGSGVCTESIYTCF